MKSIRNMLVATAMVCLLASTTFAYEAGEYSASAPGRNGDVTVHVTVSEDAITDIQVESEETENIGVLAMEELAQAVVANQSLGLDAVAGATLSSDAFLVALSDALTQAGADVQALKEVSVAKEDAPSYETEADIVVVGAGGAGLTAAVTAAKEGYSVIVLEKSGVIGGNSLCSVMGINAAGAKVQEELGMEYATPELLKALQIRYGGREELVDAYVENSGKTVDWFAEELGVVFSKDEPMGGHQEEQAPVEDPMDLLPPEDDGHPSGSDLFMVKAQADGFTSNTLINTLSSQLDALGIQVYVNTEATSLLTDENGQVVGVLAKGAQDEVSFTAKAVLLATGGFGKNHEMVVEVRPDLENAVTDEIAPTTGDGIRMATEIGAKTVDLSCMQTFPHVVVGDTWLPPMAMPGGFMTTAIFVNQDAKRYTTEGFDSATADTLLQSKSFVIFGEEDLNDNLLTLEKRGFVKSAESAAELADLLGLDGQALAETIDTYNADCEAGSDSLFGHQNLKKIEGKLYGSQMGVGAHYMMGGVLINADTQVLDEEENPIPGLYAAGEVTGGFHGTIRVDGSGTGDAFVFGHLAGEKIAEAFR